MYCTCIVLFSGSAASGADYDKNTVLKSRTGFDLKQANGLYSIQWIICARAVAQLDLLEITLGVLVVGCQRNVSLQALLCKVWAVHCTSPVFNLWC